MISIIMDTSHQYLGIGLYKDHILLEKYLKIGLRRQSEDAIPVLQSLLEKQNISLMDVDTMIITAGPGSYTGVRVAMTIAKTLAVISDVKIKVVSSLAALCGLEKCISIIDARSKKVYVGMYDKGIAVIEDTMMSIEDALDFINDHPDYKTVGQLSVLGLEDKETDIINHIHDIEGLLPVVENPELLVPQYIKNVEAKKSC